MATLDGKDTTGILGEKVIATQVINSDPDRIAEYDLLILPGGAKAMEYLRQSRTVLAAILEFYRRGKAIGAICHGAQLLISAGVVKGLNVAGYYSIKDDIINAGGKYCDTIASDGPLVTASHYKHLGPWMKEVLRVAQL